MLIVIFQFVPNNYPLKIFSWNVPYLYLTYDSIQTTQALHQQRDEHVSYLSAIDVDRVA